MNVVPVYMDERVTLGRGAPLSSTGSTHRVIRKHPNPYARIRINNYKDPVLLMGKEDKNGRKNG